MRRAAEDLKKQLAYWLESLQNQVSESHLFNLLSERFESLSLARQKLIKYGGAALLLILLALIPLSYFISSLSHWREFQEKRAASLEMLQIRSRPRVFFSQPSESEARLRIANILKKYKKEGYLIKDRPKKWLNKKTVREVSFEVEADLLNVREAVQAGAELQALPQTRLSSFELKESQEHPRRYKAVFFVSAFLSKTAAPAPRGSRPGLSGMKGKKKEGKRRKRARPAPAGKKTIREDI